jgi:hypothetical protein
MKVWIELERPEDKEQGAKYAEKYNAMLKKMGFTSFEFYWYEPKRQWWQNYTNGRGYLVMTDNGIWISVNEILELATA